MVKENIYNLSIVSQNVFPVSTPMWKLKEDALGDIISNGTTIQRIGADGNLTTLYTYPTSIALGFFVIFANLECCVVAGFPSASAQQISIYFLNYANPSAITEIYSVIGATFTGLLGFSNTAGPNFIGPATGYVPNPKVGIVYGPYQESKYGAISPSKIFFALAATTTNASTHYFGQVEFTLVRDITNPNIVNNIGFSNAKANRTISKPSGWSGLDNGYYFDYESSIYIVLRLGSSGSNNVGLHKFPEDWSIANTVLPLASVNSSRVTINRLKDGIFIHTKNTAAGEAYYIIDKDFTVISNTLPGFGIANAMYQSYIRSNDYCNYMIARGSATAPIPRIYNFLPLSGQLLASTATSLGDISATASIPGLLKDNRIAVDDSILNVIDGDFVPSDELILNPVTLIPEHNTIRVQQTYNTPTGTSIEYYYSRKTGVDTWGPWTLFSANTFVKIQLGDTVQVKVVISSDALQEATAKLTSDYYLWGSFS